MYKNLSSQVKDVDKQGRIVVAANAFGNVDSDSDVSMTGSFTKTIKENFTRLRWFLNHDRTKLLGVPLEGIETPQYLQITGQLNLNKEIGRDIYEDYKLYAEYGKSLEHSIGVDPIKYQDDQGIRKVTEWKLWEYSTLTSWGANERTPMINLKNHNPAATIDWLELILKKGNYTDEKCIAIETQLESLKSLVEPEQPTPYKEPIQISDLADISTSFINSLT
jgi:HK97 family phage prohead protease